MKQNYIYLAVWSAIFCLLGVCAGYFYGQHHATIIQGGVFHNCDPVFSGDHMTIRDSTFYGRGVVVGKKK